jgi:hypothetical protein
MKICSKCGQEKKEEDFSIDTTKIDNLYSSCKLCRIKYYSKNRKRMINLHRQYEQSIKGKKTLKHYRETPQGYYSILKYNAKLRKINFDLTKEEYINWYNKQERRCIYCNITEDELKKKQNHYKRLTIDRKDNNKGYELDNIVLCCYRCNTIKGNSISYEKMIKIGEIIQNG